MKMFNKVKIEVLYCDKSVVVMAFYKDLLSDNKSHHFLVKTRPEIMAEVHKGAYKYINLEEELDAGWLRKRTNYE